MKDARTLADQTVFDLEGQPVALGSLWRQQPLVLAFVRHFG